MKSRKLPFGAAVLSLGASIFATVDGRHIAAALSGAAALLWFVLAARAGRAQDGGEQ